MHLNTDHAPVNHPLKTNFDIENYNSMWFDNQYPSTKPTLSTMCANFLPPKVVKDHHVSPISPPRSDIIDEIIVVLTYTDSLQLQSNIMTESPITPSGSVLTVPFHQHFLDSNNTLCRILYKGANTFRSKWYLVHI